MTSAKRALEGRLLLAGLLCAGLACGDDDPTATVDAGAPDTGAPDTGTPDTGTPDMGTPDMGATPSFALHYHRVDRSYEGWSVELGGDVTNPGTVALDGTDGFGGIFPAELAEGASSLTFQFTNGTEVEPAEPMMVELDGAEGVWWFDGATENPLTRAPDGIPGENQVVVYYVRGDRDYAEWGLHLWGDVEETAWEQPMPRSGIDEVLGAYWVVDVFPGGDRVNLIVHIGDRKDPGPDMGFNITTPEAEGEVAKGDIVFVRSGSAEIHTVPQFVPPFQIDGMKAHWVSPDLLLFGPEEGAASYELRAAAEADIAVTPELDVTGGEVVLLEESSTPIPEPVREKFPHLADRGRLRLPASAVARAPDWLRGQLVVVARNASGAPVAATRVQTPGVLDALYGYDGELGVSFDGQTPTIRLWAPTARTVELQRFDANKEEIETVPMVYDADTGTWTASGDASWYGSFYRYLIEVYHPVTDRIETFRVTDPYSVSLSIDSEYSQIIDLDDPALKPAGWDTLTLPPLAAPEDAVIYEGHVRDFSIFDTSVAEEDRGKFTAFTYDGRDGRPLSNGMAHLSELARAGLTIFHMLPSFDIATVPEDPGVRVEITDGFDRLCILNQAVPMADCTLHGSTPIQAVLAGLDPSTDEAQRIVNWMRGMDGFNWGYDPFHYTTPEGSYSTNPEGPARILELRQAVMSLAGLGLRTAMDVVYNHTNASGTGDKSVLDKVVPGYYHRLNPDTGNVERSTCCDNTATEHDMMEKLMVDSLVTWARDYKIGAFRFDLMGHHMVRNMLRVQDNLRQIDPQIYVYGEGWDFGEVQGGARGPNATQARLAGTGIGTFNDRVRDAVRGGGPFDSAGDLRANQGFATGLYTAPNEANSGSEEERTTLLQLADLTRLGMAGNLKDFRLVVAGGRPLPGSFVSYNGARAGYTEDPQESVNYVSKHDNQTLFDIAAYKLATGTPMTERVRRHNLAVATTVLGQGVPFLHLGVDLLRSKSMERDSYDSGDWFNRVDWTGQTNNWNVGLPSAEKDSGNYDTIAPIIADASIAPTAEHIALARRFVLEVLRIRSSSELFRLRTREQVMSRVDYLNVGPDQVPGMIVQTVTDGTCAGDDLDPALDGVVVVVNASPREQSFSLSGAASMALHPVLASSSDPVVQSARVDAVNDALVVPALTTAAFVLPQTGPQGSGLPCNTH